MPGAEQEPEAWRAPMRSRVLDLPPGTEAADAVARGRCAIGGVVAPAPESLDEALAAVADRHGERFAARLRRFAALPERTFVWTREADGCYRLGRLAGPWRYEADHEELDLPHARPARWLDDRLAEEDVPPSVAETFGRGGRNLQRIHDPDAGPASAALWRAATGD